MRSCGIDVSARAANQQLATLEAHGGRLVATFPAPATVEGVAQTVAALAPDAVGIDAPSGWRLDLLGAGAPARAALDLPAGRYERMRVCDALLFRRGLPLYPVPSAAEGAARWQRWMLVGFELFAALRGDLGLYAPADASGRFLGTTGRFDPDRGRAFETYPDAVFCVLLGHRPEPKRTAGGRRARIAALEGAGVVGVAGEGLAQRTLDELDACAAALAAHALAAGRAQWLGDAAEGVVVLPGEALRDRYRKPQTFYTDG